MPVTQTVFINIVVKGSVPGSATIDAPLSSTKKKALEVTSSVENINKAMQETATKNAALSAQLTLPFDRVAQQANVAAKNSIILQQSLPFGDMTVQGEKAAQVVDKVAQLEARAAEKRKNDQLALEQYTAKAEDRKRTLEAKTIAQRQTAEERANTQIIAQAQTSALREEKLRAESAVRLTQNKQRAAQKASEDELALIQYTAKSEDRLRSKFNSDIISSYNQQSAAKAKTEQEALALTQHTANQENKLREQIDNVNRKSQAEQLSLLQFTARQEDTLRTKKSKEETALIAQQAKIQQKAENDRLALLQYTAKAEDKLRAARLKLEEEASKKGTWLQRVASGDVGEFVARSLMTLQKALISMIGVMAMYTAFITIPEMIAKGFLAIAAAAIRTKDEIDQLQITLASLISSTLDFGGSAKENFAAAQQWARSVYLDFVRLSTQSLATPHELGLAYQSFLAAGGAQFVKNLDEQVQLTGLLANSVLTLTGRQQTERQLFTEIRAVLEGTMNAGSQLARFLRGQVGDLNTWLSKIRNSKDGLVEFTKVLAPFKEAGEAQGKTFTGLTTSIRGFAEALNAAAMGGGAFKLLLGYLTGVRDALGSAIRELTSFDEKSGKLSASTQSVVNAFSNIAATIETSIITLLKMAGVVVDINDPAKALEQTSIGIMIAFATTVSFVRSLGEMFSAAWLPVKILISLLYVVMDLTILIGLYILGWVSGIDANIKKIDEMKKRLSKNAAELGAELKQLPSLPEKFFGVGEFDPAKYRDKMIADMKIMAAEAAKAIQEAFKPQQGNAPAVKNIIEALSEQQIKTLNRLRMELDLLKADQDELLKIWIHQVEKSKELGETYKNTPKALGQALSINNQITKEMLKQADIKIERSTLQNLSNQILASKASLNEYNAADDKLRATEIEINNALTHRSGLIRENTDLAREAVIAELEANSLKQAQRSELSMIAERSGAIAEIEERRLRDVIAIGNMERLNIEQKNRLLAATNQQYNAERALVDLQNRKRAASEMLDLFKQLEQMQGRFTAIRSLEYDRISAESKIRSDMNIQADEARIMLNLIAQIYEYKVRQAELEAQIRNAQVASDRTRSVGTDLQDAIDAYTHFRGSIDDVTIAQVALRIQMERNDDLLKDLREQARSASGDELKKLEDQIRNLTHANLEAQRSLDAFASAQEWANRIIQRGQQAMEDYCKGTISGLKMVIAVAQAAAVILAQGLGQAFQSMFTAMQQGESVMAAFKKWIGDMLIQIGNWAVTMAAIKMLAGLLGVPVNWAAAAALMAAGVAAIAAGVALGGGGATKSANAPSQTSNAALTPVYVNQRDVQTQQGMQHVMNENTRAINNLNSEVSRLSKESGDTLVQKSVKKNPNAILQPLISKVGNSYSLQKSFGGAMMGENA